MKEHRSTARLEDQRDRLLGRLFEIGREESGALDLRSPEVRRTVEDLIRIERERLEAKYGAEEN